MDLAETIKTIEVGSGLGSPVTVTYDGTDESLVAHLEQLHRLGIPRLCECGSGSLHARRELFLGGPGVINPAVSRTIFIWTIVSCERCGSVRMWRFA